MNISDTLGDEMELVSEQAYGRCRQIDDYSATHPDSLS